MPEKAIKIVRDYAINHLDKSDKDYNDDFHVFIVWQSKTLQNWKFLLSTSLRDGMYYELTFDGDNSTWYLDAYKKFENKYIEDFK